jgi:hypothetical protein
LPDDEARLKATLGRTEAGQPGALRAQAGDIVGELALKKLPGVGSAGAHHAPMGDAASAIDEQ